MKLNNFSFDNIDVSDNIFTSNENLNQIKEDREEINIPIDSDAVVKPTVSIVEDSDAENYQEDKLRLFTTKTCPNCRKVEELLDTAGLRYSIVDAVDNPEECHRLGIIQAPTLIVNDVDKYVNISNIIKYVENKVVITD